MVSCCQRVLNGDGEQVPFWDLYECEEDRGELIHVRDSKNCVFFYPANDMAVSILPGWSKRSPARPQRVKGRGVPLRYVEGLNDARTKREAFFSILIIPLYSPWQRDRCRAWR